MRWLVFTNGDMNSAASRIMAYYPLRFSSFAQRHQVSFNPLQVKIEETDVLYIQKCFIPAVAEVAKYCRAAGKKIIFALDDPPEAVTAFDNSAMLNVYLSVSDYIVAGTPEHAAYLQQRFSLPRLPVLVRTCIDIPDESQIAREWAKPDSETRPFTAVWFGNDINFESVRLALAELAQIENFSICVVGGPSLGKWIADNKLPYRFIPWSLDIWERHRGAFDISILSHFGDPTNIIKSENKMLTSLAYGVLPIVSRTPGYERGADRLNLNDCVFASTPELVKIVQDKRNDRSRSPFDSIRRAMIENYSREGIAGVLEALANT